MPLVWNHHRITRPPALYVFWKMVRKVLTLGLGTSRAKLTQATLRPLAKLQIVLLCPLVPAAAVVPAAPPRPPAAVVPAAPVVPPRPAAPVVPPRPAAPLLPAVAVVPAAPVVPPRPAAPLVPAVAVV